MIKVLFNILGTLALILAVLGIFLPLLPTTPFVLLASACYLRGSDRLHGLLMRNRVLGPYIANIQNGRGIPIRAKATALVFLWVSLAFSAWFIPYAWLRIFLLIPGVAVTAYLLRTKTLPTSAAQPGAD